MKPRYPSQPDLFRPKAVASPRQVERVQLVDLELVHEPQGDTRWAYCVRLSWDSERQWLPRSETEQHGATFTLPRWLAVEKGLI